MSKSALYLLIHFALLATFIRGSSGFPGEAKVDELQHTSEVGKTESDDKINPAAEAGANYKITSPSECLETYGELYMNSSFILSVETFVDPENPSLKKLKNITFAEAFIKSLNNGSTWVIMDGYIGDCIVMFSERIKSGDGIWIAKADMPVYINDEFFVLDDYPFIYSSSWVGYKIDGKNIQTELHRIQFVPEGYKREFEISVAMVTHHSLHKAFMELEDDCLSDAEKSENAEKKLRSDLEALANEVDEMFGTLRGIVGDFRVTLMKTVITTKEEELLSYEKGRIDNQTINGNKALSHCFKAIIDNNTLDLPKVDLVIIFTRDTLNFRNKFTRSVVFPETMCIIKNMVIIKYDEFGSTRKITTQTIAVTLNMKFDGDRDEDEQCKSEDNYIMADNFTQTWGNKNMFMFSTCSSFEADQWIRWLDRMVRFNCLDKTKGRPRPNKPEKTLSLLSGELHNLNDQCRMIVGPKSYYCGNENVTRKNVVCKSIRCYANETCSSIPKFVLDGTSCANWSWCQRGDCVLAARAPKLLQLPTLRNGKCEETTTAGPEKNLTLSTEANSIIPAKNGSYKGSSDVDDLS